ncbi:MAG: GtrA family protein [Betaproteobacteria bacterium]|nr:GtrA family protein [Betaproteobacteria bacterium]
MKRIATQFLRFLGVGGLATALHYAIMAALVVRGWMGPVAASTLGFSVSAVLNYRLNHRFTFRSGQDTCRRCLASWLWR